MRSEGWLIDSYRAGDRVAVWLRTHTQNVRLLLPYTAVFYTDSSSAPLLENEGLRYHIVDKSCFDGSVHRVCEVQVRRISLFEQLIERLERRSRHRIRLYQADIPPEQQFLFHYRIWPGAWVCIDGRRVHGQEVEPPGLTTCTIHLQWNNGLSAIIFDGKTLGGSSLLTSFISLFSNKRPDVVFMPRAFSQLPLLVKELQRAGIPDPFHRWDARPLRGRGGKSFYSYGRVVYREFALRLHGRLLVDSRSPAGECSVAQLFELARHSGARIQQIASRSFGYTFQHAVMCCMWNRGQLIPYKDKPADIPLSLSAHLKGDRGGHLFDARVGWHRDVAEIDFSSMYPWIMYQKNISAETILSGGSPFVEVPEVGFSISQEQQGIIPEALEPFLQARMRYKAQGDPRANALKSVLVTAYGYLRFREFKLGVASAHMATCAFARDILLTAARTAEEEGFRVVHGIVDSLYLKKRRMRREEVEGLCERLSSRFGIPVNMEGMFSWMVFLPSMRDAYRPVPTAYFGAYRLGDIKVRGIEMRQSSSPVVVKRMQQEVLERMAACCRKQEIEREVDALCAIARRRFRELSSASAGELVMRTRLSRSDYDVQCVQRNLVGQLRDMGYEVKPGQQVDYIPAPVGPVVVQQWDGDIDHAYYRSLFSRALFMVLRPFGVTLRQITERLRGEVQSALPSVLNRYIMLRGSYSDHRGVAERQVRRRLEREGWETWRGGSLTLARRDTYPHLRRKYERLISLIGEQEGEFLQYLCAIHHGMPDLICYRHGACKFVEVKFRHEPVRPRQRQCISTLINKGYEVEIYRVVTRETRTRRAYQDLASNRKRVCEVQESLAKYRP